MDISSRKKLYMQMQSATLAVDAGEIKNLWWLNRRGKRPIESPQLKETPNYQSEASAISENDLT